MESVKDLNNEARRMDIDEFVHRGYLQEANRQFFHPLGLVLGVCKSPETADGVPVGPSAWIDIQRTNDPEGYIFGGESALTESDVVRGEAIEAEQQAHFARRLERLGFDVQPLIAEPA